jgi:hypothetical protein
LDGLEKKKKKEKKKEKKKRRKKHVWKCDPKPHPHVMGYCTAVVQPSKP